MTSYFLMEHGFTLMAATQHAAAASAGWIGRGDKNRADQAAVDAMRLILNASTMKAKVVIGEGEKDEAPMLYNGEELGRPSPEIERHMRIDIAVDPLDGTTQTARGGPEAMSVIAAGNEGSLFPAPSFYMKKIAVGPSPNGLQIKPDLKWPLPQLVEYLSWQLGKPVSTLTVCLLDRPRHAGFIEEFRRLGCRIKLIADCDVSAAIATAHRTSSVDLYYGIGGAPEGVLAAAAMKCLGGYFEGQLVDAEGKPTDDRVYALDDLAKNEVMFCATGVTDGSLLKGVRRRRHEVVVDSILMHFPTRHVHRVTTTIPLV